VSWEEKRLDNRKIIAVAVWKALFSKASRARMMEDKVKITFDKDYKIRIMDPTKFARSEQLDLECTSFLESIIPIPFLIFL
jgi:hypothetical protein